MHISKYTPPPTIVQKLHRQTAAVTAARVTKMTRDVLELESWSRICPPPVRSAVCLRMCPRAAQPGEIASVLIRMHARLCLRTNSPLLLMITASMHCLLR